MKKGKNLLTLVAELCSPIILCGANCANRGWHLAVMLLAILEIDSLPIQQLGDANASATCSAALGAGAGAVVSMAFGLVAFGIHEVPHRSVWRMLS